MAEPTEPTDPTELLSAYLDGELDPSEQVEMEAWLARSADMRRELAELSATKTLVRTLPSVEPLRRVGSGMLGPVNAESTAPAGLPGVVNRRRRLALTTLAVAAVWMVILSVGVGVGRLPVVPDIEALSAQHASASPMEGFEAMSSDEMADDPGVMADIGHEMVLADLYQRDELVHARYSDGLHAVSIFHQPGRVDWASLPVSGEVAMMPTGRVWTTQMDGSAVLITERGDLVVTVVADGDMEDEMAMAVSEMVPPVEMSQSAWSRLKEAPGNFIDWLS
jgi:hypothetical protein